MTAGEKRRKRVICQHCGRTLGQRKTAKGAMALFERHWRTCDRKGVEVPCDHKDHPPPPGYV